MSITKIGRISPKLVIQEIENKEIPEQIYMFQSLIV